MCRYCHTAGLNHSYNCKWQLFSCATIAFSARYDVTCQLTSWPQREKAEPFALKAVKRTMHNQLLVLWFRSDKNKRPFCLYFRICFSKNKRPSENSRPLPMSSVFRNNVTDIQLGTSKVKKSIPSVFLLTCAHTRSYSKHKVRAGGLLGD